jgi:serine/threonine protein kinase/tetratricopeptide (TPR) repeat protein
MEAMPCLDENDVVRFLEGGATTADEDHIDACEDCRMLVTELGRSLSLDLEPADDPALARGSHPDQAAAVLGEIAAWELASGAELVGRGARVGRYVVLDPLGAGAMGVVYRAYDPELDRDVALKLVRVLGESARGDEARARLVREAQSLARVAHPNVVAVYDASTYGDHVFVAMELVEGVNLEEWLAANAPERRSCHAIASRFAAAGRGLAAAHAAGVIHRDVKAANILVGNDGRARITDFGLAIAREDVAPAREDGEHARDTAPAFEHIAGTPAYMSPEVRAGEPANEKSDQYSFALALRRALVSRRDAHDDRDAHDGRDTREGRDTEAHDGRDTHEGRDAHDDRDAYDGRDTHEGRDAEAHDTRATREVDAPIDAPRVVQRILARALAEAPADRFLSMTQMLDALDRALLPRRWPIAVGAGAATLASIVMVFVMRAPVVAPVCADPVERFVGVWDPSTKSTIRRAFAASGHPLASDQFVRAEASLDGFARAWSASYLDACRATHVRHEQSADLLDRRMACLSDELGRMRAVTTQLASADRALVARAIGASDIGDRLARCSDLVALRAAAPLPATPALRARGAAAASALAYAEAISLRAKFQPAIAMAKAVTIEARAIGDLRLEADSLRSAGETQWRSGDYAGALATLHDAVDAAKRAGGNDLEAGALLDIVAVLVEQGSYGEGLQVARLAESTIRAYGDDARLAKLLGNRGAIHYLQGNFAAAKADYESALALFEKAFGANDRRVGQTVMNLAMLAAEGDTVDPLPLYARALAIHEKALGSKHPEVALTLSNRAIALANKGRFDDAYADLDRALSTRTEVLGANHRDTIGTLQTMGLVAEEQKNYGKAIAVQRDVLARFGTSVAADHPTRGHTLATIGRAQVELGEYREAIEPLEHAIAIFEKAKIAGPASSSARFALAKAIIETSGDRTDGNRTGGDRTGGNRARARTLVETALAELGADGDADRRAEMRAWLATHGAAR